MNADIDAAKEHFGKILREQLQEGGGHEGLVRLDGLF